MRVIKFIIKIILCPFILIALVIASVIDGIEEAISFIKELIQEENV